GAQPVGQPLAFRNAIKIRDVPELFRLLLDRFHHARMRVAERVDGDARGEIEIALAIGRDQPDALAALEGEIDAGVGRQKMRAHGLVHRSATSCLRMTACDGGPRSFRGHTRGPEKKYAASPGGTVFILLAMIGLSTCSVGR